MGPTAELRSYPNYTNPFGPASASADAFGDAELCLVTHGHFDHIQDVPALMKASRMSLVASPEVCVRRVAGRDRPDLVVAGAQLDYPAQVAEAAAILRPKRLVLFHPHEAYFDFITLRSRPPEDFVSVVRAAAPDVQVETAEPGRRVAF